MTHVIKLDEETLALHRRTQSSELAGFYVWWWEHRHGADAARVGLCSLLREYMIGLDKSSVMVRGEMRDQFVQCSLDPSYPFGRDEYFVGRIYNSMAKDENRIAWVRSHLPDNYKGPR